MNPIGKIFIGAVSLGLASIGHCAEPSGTMKKIKDSGTILIGYRADAVPFSMVEGSNNPTGYTIDLCSRIVDNIKQELALPDLKVKYVLVKSGDRIQKMVDGEDDLECASTTNTKERAAKVGFANTIFVTSTRILVKSDSGIKGIDDLKDRKIAIAQGASVAPLISKIDAEKQLNIKYSRVKDFTEGFDAIEAGRVDAFVSDDIQFAGFIGRSSHPKNYAVVGDPLSTDPLSIMMRKDDSQLQNIVNRTLSNLVASGEFNKIYNKWFMTPQMKFPMPEALKVLLKSPNNLPNY